MERVRRYSSDLAEGGGAGGEGAGGGGLSINSDLRNSLIPFPPDLVMLYPVNVQKRSQMGLWQRVLNLGERGG